MDKIDDIIKNNEDAIVNIDLMVALTLVMGIIIVAIHYVPIISQDNKDWRIKQYTVSVRATDNMVQNRGDPVSWNINWTSGKYNDVKKIGFLYSSKPIKKVLDIEKIRALMGDEYKDNYTNTIWWEFPTSNIDKIKIDNATRSFGLTEYNFYMQLHPVGLDYFDPIPLQINITNKNINLDTASVVDRYVYIIDPSIDDKIKYLRYDNEAVHYRLTLWVW